MTERTGGSTTVVNGRITETVTPATHPGGDRSRDAQGRIRDARGRSVQPAPAVAPPVAAATASVSALPVRRGRSAADPDTTSPGGAA